ncbi:flowering-promoting factor 1-like protein 3 [Salvia hispanica]|uniref:flowering-promoting factor 1-like protein 3 n=1 Tax=Salvia hispanica TaxID=49212 RepID=UPI002009B75A|nr:flowering-promoting factor 1-like protein 3 [Salvia hispanica]
MSGVWAFKDGVVRLVENDKDNAAEYHGKKKLVHVPSNEVMASYDMLQSKLTELGWERYYEDPGLLQFHKKSTINLISLPKDFNKFWPVHMNDIIVKNPNVFEVRDVE